MLSQVPLKQLIQVLDVVWQGAVCVCVYVCVCACLISTYLYAYSYTIFDFYFRLLEMTLREPFDASWATLDHRIVLEMFSIGK